MAGYVDTALALLPGMGRLQQQLAVGDLWAASGQRAPMPQLAPGEGRWVAQVQTAPDAALGSGPALPDLALLKAQAAVKGTPAPTDRSSPLGGLAAFVARATGRDKATAPGAPVAGYVDTADGALPAAYAPLVRAAARAQNLDPALIAAVLGQESGADRYAVSPKGATGLMQLMPDTARALGVTDPFDPAQNIHAGARYLRQMIDQFGSVELGLAAYNAGPGTVQRAGSQIPAIPETQAYVPRVMQRYRDLQRAYQQAPTITTLALGGVSQNELGLPPHIAAAFCGPAAALWAARVTGGNPSVADTLNLARETGWSEAGQAGPQAQVTLMQRLGVPAQLGAINPARIAGEVQAGRPVILSSPGSQGHYFQVTGYDPATGRFRFGDAVGKRAGWIPFEQISSLGWGTPNVAIYLGAGAP